MSPKEKLTIPPLSLEDRFYPERVFAHTLQSFIETIQMTLVSSKKDQSSVQFATAEFLSHGLKGFLRQIPGLTEEQVTLLSEIQTGSKLEVHLASMTDEDNIDTLAIVNKDQSGITTEHSFTFRNKKNREMPPEFEISFKQYSAQNGPGFNDIKFSGMTLSVAEEKGGNTLKLSWRTNNSGSASFPLPEPEILPENPGNP